MMGNQNHAVSETRLAKTLFIITAASLLTWLPFQILLLLLKFGVIGNLPYVDVIRETGSVSSLLRITHSLSLASIRRKVKSLFIS